MFSSVLGWLQTGSALRHLPHPSLDLNEINFGQTSSEDPEKLKHTIASLTFAVQGSLMA
jgi:hypothetical protein